MEIKDDRTICEEAQHYFNLKDYEKSAELFAASKKPFEDVCLMFMDVNCTKALRKYLIVRLNDFKSLTTQLTMTLSWLFELIISSMTILETQENSPKVASELDELYSDLELLLDSKQVVRCLKRHANLFYSIIQNYANWRIYIKVARLIGDHEQLIRAYLNARKYDEALQALKEVKRADLFYIHGHLIMKHKPRELVDALIDQPDIDPSKLIPILIQENPYYNKCCETIRYLEHCVRNLRTHSKIIHNNLFELYARYRDEDTLIAYLEEEISPDNAQLQGYLDLQTCLRVCTRLKLVKTCVVIYSLMGLYDEAVNLALEFDVSLAKNIAKRVESEDHQKRLWLSIAKCVLTDEADIQIAAELLSESKLLKIEDVLIFFPDYKTVGSIESSLHQSLQDKRNEIMSIRDGTYEIIVNEIRSEIKSFEVRYSKLRYGQKCEICSQNIMSRSHYVFPCGHLFHYDCIIKEIMSVDPQYKNIEDKLKQLAVDTTPSAISQQQKFTSFHAKQQSLSLNSFSSQTKLTGPLSTTGNVSSAIDREKIADELYEITSNECVYCGGFLANYIDRSATITLNRSYTDTAD